MILKWTLTKRELTKLALKLVIAAVVGLSLFVGGAILLTRLYTDITASEDTAAILNVAATLPSDLVESVEWRPDAPDLTRQMEPLTRGDITDAWLRAWSQLAIVAETGQTTGLEVYFSYSALDGLTDAIPDWSRYPVHQISHDLRVNFYSEDGSVVGLESVETRLLRRYPKSDGKSDGTRSSGASKDDTGLLWYESVEGFEAVMLLEDGNWRIQHWVRNTSEGHWWTESPAAPTGGWNDTMSDVGYAASFDVSLPQSVASFDELVAAGDLDRLTGLGIDSLRILLNYDDLGGREVDQESLGNVLRILDIAHERDLRVVVSLFDGRTDHRVENWDSDDAHLRALVPALSGHPALTLWDIKSGADRDADVDGGSMPLTEAWITHIAWTIRALDPATPTTVGWSNPEHTVQAPTVVDVISFEHDDSVAALAQATDGVGRAVPGKPVLVFVEPNMNVDRLSNFDSARGPGVVSHVARRSWMTLLVVDVALLILWFVVRRPAVHREFARVPGDKRQAPEGDS